MKILIVSPSLDETQNVSGISSVTKFIVSNNSENEYVHFELGKKDHERGGVFRIWSIICSILQWIKILNSFDGIIHYNFPLSKPSILRDPIFIAIARMRKKRMLIHVHGGIFLTSGSTPGYLRWILTKVFALPVPVVVLSELEKNLLQKNFNCSQVYVLPNCVDLKSAEHFKRDTLSDVSHIRLGYLGRIAETKGMKELLNACVKLKNEDIPFTLHIAGKEEIPNQFLPSFSNLLGANFVYEGVLSGESKNDFLKKIDIFVLPSYFEGLPMSLLECMSFGAVPVTTCVGSISEVVSNGENGLFISIRDSESIYERIKFLHENRAQMANMSQRAKETIFSTFDPKSYINELNAIYQLLIQK